MEPSIGSGSKILQSIAFEFSNDAIFIREVTDADASCFIEVNPTACKRLGYTREELLKLSPRHIDAAVIDLAQYNRRLMAEGIALFRTIHRTKDGVLIPTEINVRITEIHGKKVAISIARDLREREQMEQQLADQNRQMQVIDNISDIVLQTDLAGCIRIISPSIYNHLGYHPEHYIGKSVFEFIHSDEIAAATVAFEGILAGEKRRLELRCIDVRDDYVWFDVAGQPIVRDDGTIAGVLIASQDITEKRAAEKAVWMSEITYRTIFNSATDAMFLHEPTEFRVVDVNQKACDLFGMSRETMLQTNLAERHSPEKFALLLDYFHRTASGQPQVFEWTDKDSLGRVVLSEVHTRMIEIHGETRLLTVLRDITEQKKFLTALRESESKNKALLEALPDLMIHLDKHGVVFDYRPGKADEIINPSGTVIGRTIWDMMPPELAFQIMEHLELALTTGTPYSFEVDCSEAEVKKDLEFRLTPCYEDSCLMLIRDITERKHLERQLRYLSLHDSLTGVGNRLHFEQQITRIQEEGMGSVGVIVCDLDGLKMANDTYGHSYGDQMLIATANVLRNAVDEYTKVCRVGGDEFAILCFESDEERIRECVKKIRRGVEEYNDSKPPRALSLSIGYSNSEPTEDILDAYRTADRWMYREKLHRSQSARSEIVQTLLKALEARDFLTEGHCERMERLVVHLGERLSLPERTINDLSLLAQFHDIGKVGIRDSILFKTGPLTQEEFDEMKQHSEIGYRIAQSLSDLVPIAGAVLKHHERWDGKGYPIGLKGEEIPLECRILAIVDAFDAMTNDRPYRKALSLREAIRELERCSGSQFDPFLVSLFVRMISEEAILQ